MSKKNQVKKTPQLSLIVPARGNEPLLSHTITRARDAAGCQIEVIVVSDGIADPGPADMVITPDHHGTSYSRHAGMQAVTCDLCVTIDAHVRLCDDWAVKILYAFDPAWQKSVACGHVGHLSPDFQPMDKPCYHGARLNWMDTSAEPRPLTARWHGMNKAGDRIGAVMGAFYALRKSWYNAMGCPWELNRGWGCDEEIISLASWVNGGNCRLLPEECEAWHLFGHAGTRYAPAELAEVVRNRQRLLWAFPFTDFQRTALLAFASYPPVWREDDPGFTFFRDQYRDKGPRLQAYLLEWMTGFDRWAESRLFCPPPATPPPPPAAAVPTPTPPALTSRTVPQRLPARPVDVCRQCDGRNTFEVTNTLPTIRRYRCSRCGARAWRDREDTPLNYSIRNQE